jgi:prevent-host-death family protein
MSDTYSLYEAKAKLSAIIREVRNGRRFVVTVHGTPAAEIRPIGSDPDDLDGRMRRLADRGIVVRPGTVAARWQPMASRPGALQRFLGERSR